MQTLVVNLQPSYTIYLAHDLLKTSLIFDHYRHLGHRFVIITDDQLAATSGQSLQDNLATQGLNCALFSFPTGEEHKTRETKQYLEDSLLKQQYGRDTCIIALGGGVVTDIAGFVAATYCRGVPILYIPTTLLAMVDASIGGKTAVNTPYGKNLIGTFSQPKAVFIDTVTLETLPEKEWKNGVVEMIKHALIADEKIFKQLSDKRSQLNPEHPEFLLEMIAASCAIKKFIVEQDEKEAGMRQLLNFGHTIGHAIEILENYKIGHGEAVAIGILVESYISVKKGFLNQEIFEQIEKIFQDYQLPLATCAFQNPEKFKQALILDKKTLANQVQYVLLDGIGKPHMENQRYVMPIPEAILDETISWADNRFGATPLQ